MTTIRNVNDWLAEKITRGVGTMWCAYAFAGLSLVSLPAALSSGDALTIVSWIAQTFLQLVLLPVIMVGQAIEAKHRETHAAKLDALNEKHDALHAHITGGE